MLKKYIWKETCTVVSWKLPFTMNPIKVFEAPKKSNNRQDFSRDRVPIRHPYHLYVLLIYLLAHQSTYSRKTPYWILPKISSLSMWTSHQSDWLWKNPHNLADVTPPSLEPSNKYVIQQRLAEHRRMWNRCLEIHKKPIPSLRNNAFIHVHMVNVHRTLSLTAKPSPHPPLSSTKKKKPTNHSYSHTNTAILGRRTTAKQPHYAML